MRTKLAKTLKQVALGGALAAVATSGFAATQGTTGFTSTGDVIITMGVLDEVKISNLVDIPLGNFTGADLTGTSAACVYRSGGTGNYNISASGSGVAGAFELTDGTNSVAYAVELSDDAGTTYSGVATGGILASTNAEGVDDDCVTAGADNASIRVTVAAVDATAMPAATYTGTLYLTVSPL